MPTVELSLASCLHRGPRRDARAPSVRRVFLPARTRVNLDDVLFGCAASALCALPLAAVLFG